MTLRKYNLKYTLWEVGWKCSSVACFIANPAIYIQRPSHILLLFNTTKKVTEHFWKFLIAVNGFLKDRIKKKHAAEVSSFEGPESIVTNFNKTPKVFLKTFMITSAESIGVNVGLRLLR